jgi:hypothetical protein
VRPTSAVAIGAAVGTAVGTIVVAGWVVLEEGRRVGRPDQLEESVRIDVVDELVSRDEGAGADDRGSVGGGTGGDGG